jgi:hypothetical protein
MLPEWSVSQYAALPNIWQRIFNGKVYQCVGIHRKSMKGSEDFLKTFSLGAADGTGLRGTGFVHIPAKPAKIVLSVILVS